MGDIVVGPLNQQQGHVPLQEEEPQEPKDGMVTGVRGGDLGEATDAAVEKSRGVEVARSGTDVPPGITTVLAVRRDVMALPQRAAGAMVAAAKACALTTASVESTVGGPWGGLVPSLPSGTAAASGELTDNVRGGGRAHGIRHVNNKIQSEKGANTATVADRRICRDNAHSNNTSGHRCATNHHERGGAGCSDVGGNDVNAALLPSFPPQPPSQAFPQARDGGHSSSGSGSGTTDTSSRGEENDGNAAVRVCPLDTPSDEPLKHGELLEQPPPLRHDAQDATCCGHGGDSHMPAASATWTGSRVSSGQRELAPGVADPLSFMPTAGRDERRLPKNSAPLFPCAPLTKQTALADGQSCQEGTQEASRQVPLLIATEVARPPCIRTFSTISTDDTEGLRRRLRRETHLFSEASEGTVAMNSLTTFPIHAPSAAPLSPWITSTVDDNDYSRSLPPSTTLFLRRTTVTRCSGSGGQQIPSQPEQIAATGVASVAERGSPKDISDSFHERDVAGQQPLACRMPLSPLPTRNNDDTRRSEGCCSLGSVSVAADSANRALNRYGMRFCRNSFACGNSSERTFSIDMNDMHDTTVMVRDAGEGTDGSDGHQGRRDVGGSQDIAVEQQWLQVPALFYLVFNLIKLHETGEYQLQHERERELSEILDDSSTPLSLQRPSVRPTASLQDVYTQLSHTLFEVSGVLLQPYLTAWSDASLRESVADVAKTWKEGGFRSQEFENASFRLLGVVSADRCGKVKPTLLHRAWEFIGARRRSSHVTIGIFITVPILLASLVVLASLGGGHTVARVLLLAWTCTIVLLSAGVCLLLVNHNAVAEEVREFYFSELLSRVAAAMRDVDMDDDDDTNRNARDTVVMDSGHQSPQFHETEYCFGRLDAGEHAVEGDAFGTHTSGVDGSGMIFPRGNEQPPSKRHSVVTPTAVVSSGLDAWPINSSRGGSAEGDDGAWRHEETHGDGSAGDGNREWGECVTRPQLHGWQEEPHEWNQQSGGCPHDVSATRQEEAIRQEDRYNALLMSRVSFEQTQLAEEHMKEMMVRKRIGVDTQDALRLNVEDVGRSSPVPSEVAVAAVPGGMPESSPMGSNGAASAPATPAAVGGSGVAMSPNSRSLVPLSVRMMRDSLVNDGLDALAITALVYCRSHAVTGDIFSKLWNRNFLILQRTTLEALDAAFHRGSERFKVFLLHAPDLDEEQFRVALSWLQQERRPVFFFASALGTMGQEVPYAFRLELPLTTRDVETLLLSGIGVDEEMNSVSIFRPSKKFKVPPYTLGRRLGGGAYGNVFEVEMEMTGARCAVKRMYLRGDREKGAHEADSQLKEIAREVEIMSSLSHPNIVQYLFCERDDNCVSIFMELCSGGSLSELIAGGGLRHADEVKRALRDVIAAVAYLHGKHIVHRDLKPENVLFRAGRAKVSDFGTAVFKRGGLKNVKGTFAYMAPEVLLGETYGKACDVWSFGCIAADALSIPLGHRALGLPELCDHYRRMSLDETLEFDCDEPTVRGFMQLCLQRDPKKRSSVEELLEHPMLREEGDTAVQRWLMMCAERRRGQQSDGVSDSSSFTRANLRTGSASAISLRSADVLGARCTPRQTPTTPSFF